MNQRVFIYPLSGFLIFLIGFFIVGATKKKLVMPDVQISVDDNTRVLDNDTLRIFETQSAQFQIIQEMDSANTEWFINKHPQPAHRFLEKRFDTPGFYEISIQNKAYLEKAIPVIVQEAVKGHIDYDTHANDEIMVDNPTFFRDSTEGVVQRQWMVNGQVAEEQGEVFECTFSESKSYTVQLRSVLQDSSIALWEEQINVQPKPQPVRRRPSSGGAPARPSGGFIKNKTVGLKSAQLIGKTNFTVEGPKATCQVKIVESFELQSVKLIGTSGSGQIKLSVTHSTGRIIAEEVISGGMNQKTISFPTGTELLAGNTYIFSIELKNGASVGAVDIYNTDSAIYSNPEKYFTITSPGNNRWLFDWTIYTR